jgi:hypothetical protein
LRLLVGWETRKKGTRRYYTRSRRKGGRVVREYIGAGVLGRLAAQLDEFERRQREEETAYWREERERFEQNAAFVGELEEAAEILSQAHLIAAGFHKRRGEWRRRARESGA